MNLTNKLNFSLTKKRLMLLAKKSSTAQLYTKAIPVMVSFALSLFLFFDRPSELNLPSAIRIQEFWDNQTYSDVTLELQGFPFGEDSVDLFSRIPSLSLLNGEPFSGVENIYDKKTDRLKISNVYIDGLPVHQKVFDEDGINWASVDFFYNPQKTRRYSTRYYESGILALETIFSSLEHDGKRVLRFWDQEGYLKSVVISEVDTTKPKTSEMINYDPEGNVIFHERWLNGELSEKLK